jgi:hypothetical protein
VTRLIESGYDGQFVTDQVGHSHAATTAICKNPRELHQMGEELQVA